MNIHDTLLNKFTASSQWFPVARVVANSGALVPRVFHQGMPHCLRRPSWTAVQRAFCLEGMVERPQCAEAPFPEGSVRFVFVDKEIDRF